METFQKIYRPEFIMSLENNVLFPRALAGE
jgi:iron-sulfur cluster repair protein YtfE (RIC family)